MSQNLAALLALANDAAETYSVNMAEVSKGGGARRLFKPGYAYARLCRYVEFGKQPQEYGGKAKDPALEFRLGFAIWGDVDPANPGQPENLFHNEDGTPNFMGTWDMALGNNEKSKAKRIFDKLNYKGGARHFAQLLGEGFLIPVKLVDVPAKSGKPASQRNELDLLNALAPFDVVSRQPYPIPAAPDDAYQLFLWNKPTKEGWDALHIDGQRDDGTSKNFLQDKILGAVDFMGSPLEALLRGAGAALPSPEQLAGAAPEVAVLTPAPAVTPAAPDVPAVATAVVPALPVMPPDVPFVGGTIPEVATVPELPPLPIPPVA